MKRGVDSPLTKRNRISGELNCWKVGSRDHGAKATYLGSQLFNDSRGGCCPLSRCRAAAMLGSAEGQRPFCPVGRRPKRSAAECVPMKIYLA